MAYDKASRRLLPRHMKIDTEAMSDEAGCFYVDLIAPDAVQNSTTLSAGIPLASGAKLIEAVATYTTIVAGGAITGKVVALDASDSATSIDLTTDENLEGLTNDIGKALTLDSTNVALDKLDVIKFAVTADNNSVSGAGVSGRIRCKFRKVAETSVAFTDVG